MTAPMVRARGVSKSFPQRFDLAAYLRSRGAVAQREVLHDVHFDAAAGEVVGLLGANGAGKTTLLKMIAAIVLPSSGVVTVGGIDTARNPMGARRLLGFAPADHRSFYYRLTAMQNLEYFGTMAGIPPAELTARIAATMRFVDLDEDLNRKFSVFSSGMRHRLTIARALLHDPPLVLLDEPTHSLDPAHAAQLRALVRNRLARSGKTIVLSTNMLEEAWELCDRVAVLRDGRIAAFDAPSKLRARLRVPARYRILLDRPDPGFAARLRDADCVREVHARDDDVCVTVELHAEGDLNGMLSAASSNGVRIRRVEPVEPRPSEVFSSIVESGL